MDTISNAPHLEDISAWSPPGSCASIRLLRLDKLHPVVSGNKWFKLRYHIADAIAQGRRSLLTFGGGYSNHLVATAYAAQLAGLRSIGVVRGSYEHAELTPTLRACAAYGMKLVPVSKAAYKTDISIWLQQQFPGAYIIPEGGAGEAGIRGAAGLAGLIPADATDVCVPVGTGTTLAGLHRALPPDVRLHGFCAARSCASAGALLEGIPPRETLQIHEVIDPRFGRWRASQLDFMKRFYETMTIPLDVVYTGKMMQALEVMLGDGRFDPNSRIVCVHTGGLQGNPPGLFA